MADETYFPLVVQAITDGFRRDFARAMRWADQEQAKTFLAGRQKMSMLAIKEAGRTERELIKANAKVESARINAHEQANSAILLAEHKHQLSMERMRSNRGGAGNLRQGGLSAILGADWEQRKLNENIRIGTAEMAKLGIRTRAVTVAMNALKVGAGGFVGLLTGGSLMAGVLAIQYGVRKIKEMWAESTREAKKHREELEQMVASAEKINRLNLLSVRAEATLQQGAGGKGTPSYMAFFAERGYAGAPGLDTAVREAGLSRHYDSLGSAMAKLKRTFEEMSTDMAKEFASAYLGLSFLTDSFVKLEKEAREAEKPEPLIPFMTRPQASKAILADIASRQKEISEGFYDRRWMKDIDAELARAKKQEEDRLKKEEEREKAWDAFVMRLDAEREANLKKQAEEEERARVAYGKTLVRRYDSLGEDIERAIQQQSKTFSDQTRSKLEQYGVSNPAQTLFEMRSQAGTYGMEYLRLQTETEKQTAEIVRMSNQLSKLADELTKLNLW